MKHLINKLILIVYCFLGIFFLNINTEYVLEFLCAAAPASSSCFFVNKKYITAMTVLYAIAGLFFVPCLSFFPLLCYDLFYRKMYLPSTLMAAVLVARFRWLPFPVLLLILFGGALSWYLQLRITEYEVLDNVYKKTRDDSTELNLLLKEKNKSLLEKQDYEIYTATLRERNRIAREIHDNVGHMLSRSILMLGALKTVNRQDNLSEPLANLENTLTQAMDSVRVSVHDLHDDSINLQEVMENLVGEFHGCPITLTYDMGHHVPREIKYSFITIVKEALVNISKHSNATKVKITLREHPGLWQLSIEDNGSVQGGIASSGMGLENMRERIGALNGRIDIRKDSGFHIFATVPKETNQKSV